MKFQKRLYGIICRSNTLVRDNVSPNWTCQIRTTRKSMIFERKMWPLTSSHEVSFAKFYKILKYFFFCFIVNNENVPLSCICRFVHSSLQGHWETGKLVLKFASFSKILGKNRIWEKNQYFRQCRCVYCKLTPNMHQ